MKYYTSLTSIIISILFLAFSCSNLLQQEYLEEVNNLVIINADGSNKRVLINEHYGSTEKYFVNNDSQILVKRYDDFVLLNLDGSVAKNIPTRMQMRRSCVSFDRSKVAFIGTDKDNKQELYLMDYDGDNLGAITATPNRQKRFPNFSRDGNRLLYTTMGEGSGAINIVDVSSGQVTILVQDSGSGRRSAIPYWSPIFSNDDASVFFIYDYWNDERAGYQKALCSIDTSGSDLKVVENDVSGLGNIRTASNYDKIFFVGYGSSLHLFTSDYDGLNKSDLGETPLNTFIDLSLNDEKLVFGPEESNEADIVIVNIDGSGKTILSEGVSPTISTDGSKVLFVKKAYQEY